VAGLITSPRHTDGLHRWGQSHTPHKVHKGWFWRKGLFHFVERVTTPQPLLILRPSYGHLAEIGESPLAFSLTLVAVVSLGRGSQPLLVAEDLR